MKKAMWLLLGLTLVAGCNTTRRNSIPLLPAIVEGFDHGNQAIMPAGTVITETNGVTHTLTEPWAAYQWELDSIIKARALR